MPIIECTCSVPISVDEAEQTWNAFLSQPQQAGGRPGDGRTDETIGTVYFKEEGGGRTQLTMQLDPTGVAVGDEATLRNRMDSYLRLFRDFVESR